MTEGLVEQVDILIVGAGPVGMTLHLALAAGGQKSLLLDRRPLASQQGDPRALALSYGARQLLEQINSWPSRAATPIETIHISQKDGFGRTLIDRADYALPALGYVVRYRDLAAALAAQLPPDAMLAEAEILDITPGDDHVTVTLRHAGQLRTIQSKLLVHAEGTPGDDPAVKVSDYEQHAVIAEITPTPGHNKRAWERFTPDGPLALLPLGDEYSVVFTLPPAKADAVMAMDDTAFTVALQNQFGRRLSFAKPGPRSRFPLALRLRETLVKGKEVWIGNTAQTLHPVSGQGFNLGIRDAWQLAEILLKNGVDRGSLADYAASRRLDRKGSAFFTDQIVRTFSNDCGPLKLARGLGLLALDLCPPVRHFVAKRMIWGARAWP
ncbi:2-octaprenyl-6-methoxyphenyl hydroxylase [Dechloromonas denitrificans]|uniref:2-octaprenyl-6-methoxyphenyl hydroxylase n=1 Tax=Dechloromonas denitrificans TaxID=281362 RepID=A0A133XLS3_9RHOO|nr:FAD-dependent monooxygenase [Dechloromonas denitrificans]KXB31890.1 2-octaprenyl-6-methoxyphenyl hydroxylase [Dechloromonas denitrificans]